jgi:transposase
MKREEIIAIYNQGPDAVIELVQRLYAEMESFKEMMKKFDARLNKNSSNSDKPPSSDGLNRKERREAERKSKKKRGGQPGHSGTQLKMVEHPDKVIHHSVERCAHCDHPLSEEDIIEGKQRRQVFDLPEIKLEVTEHQCESKRCPCCGEINESKFPKDIKRPAQYGNKLKSFVTYVSQYQLLPYNRIAELLKDILGIEISTGTIYNIIKSAYELTEEVESKIKEELAKQSVLHADETGLFCGGFLSWLHILSTKRLSYYHIDRKRGRAAIENMGIIPKYKGLLMHDFWKPYLFYDCNHSFCNAHLIRELKGIGENFGQTWPEEMIKLLLLIKSDVEKQKKGLDSSMISEFEKTYDQIIESGLLSNPPPLEIEKKRGRKKKTKPLNLLERMKEYKREILSYMYDVNAPFNNNQAERDLRMVKVQQKISGCFRSNEGGMFFARIRGYMSTMKKNDIPILFAMQSVFSKEPIMPNFAE